MGTISVEVSELLGDRLTKRGIKHTVLNAKPEHAEREGETIAEAGAPGAVTIATNMAGRGVDIKLGGNPEHLTRLELAKLGLKPGDPDYDERFKDVLPSIEARIEEQRETVVEAGGLFICGTERHEARRIDNQLRGRSGRQGDPGESRFFLSAEDDLVRLFAGDRIYRILDRLGTTDDEGNEEPIAAGVLTKQIEKAQRKVEEQNFLIRKRVLEYDDVMNQQREVVYEYRDRILEGRDMGDEAREQIGQVVERLVEEYTAGEYVEDWDVDGLFTQAQQIWDVDVDQDEIRPEQIEREEIKKLLTEDALELYEERQEQLGEELMRALERYLLLEIIDQRWREHLYDMDYLREGIHLRGFAQIDPLVAYKNEALHSLPGPHELDLDRLRPDDLQRRGGDRGRQRPGRRAAVAPRGRLVHRGGSVSYSGGGRWAAPRRSPWRWPAPTRAPRPTPTARWTSRSSRSRPSSNSGSPASTTRSGATTRARAARARSSRSATGPDGDRSLGRHNPPAPRGDSRPAQAARGLPLTPTRWSAASRRWNGRWARPASGTTRSVPPG